MESINVIYKFVDGAHFFVSDDKKAIGLCVASGDLGVAYGEVSAQLNALAKFNYGQDIQYVPAVPLEKFKKLIEAYKAISEVAVGESGFIKPATIQAWANALSLKKTSEAVE